MHARTPPPPFPSPSSNHVPETVAWCGTAPPARSTHAGRHNHAHAQHHNRTYNREGGSPPRACEGERG
jgi:hypothetical protein